MSFRGILLKKRTKMKKYLSLIFIVGAVLLLIGAVTYINRWALSPYLYSMGALAVAIVQIFTPFDSNDITLKRLHRQQIFGAVFLVISGVLMFTLPHENSGIFIRYHSGWSKFH